MNVSNQKDDILMATDYGYDVFRKFVTPDIRLGRNVISPLREERHPSFSIYTHGRRGDVWYKDFSEHGDQFHGDCFQFVEALFHTKDLTEAIKIIKQQVLGIYDDDPMAMKAVVKRNYKPKPIKKKGEVNFYPEFREWTYNDLRYWERFLISEKALDLFNVRPVSSYTAVKPDKEYVIRESPGDPIYFITFPSGRVKIYRPLTKDKRFKWASNVRAEMDVFGLHLLSQKVDNLFILAGNKDVMSFYATTGMMAIALNSESAVIDKRTALTLECFSGRIHTLYDNDKTGNKAANKIYLDHGYKPHGYLLDKYSYPQHPMNDYAQLVDERRDMLPDLFARLKQSMKDDSFTH